MNPTLRLKIATPAAVLFDSEQVTALRAEDESGSFGILPGHADFLTVLTPSVLRWHEADGNLHYCAIEAGILSVTAGSVVTIACRDGVLADTLEVLETQIQAARAKHLDAMRCARVEQTRIHAQAVRQLLRYLRPGASADNGVPALESDANQTGTH